MPLATLEFPHAVELLRGLAEPTRCRMLALLGHGELTVGEIAEALGQSQPRISRHLKILSDVGALERFREEQRVYYRLTGGTPEGELVAQALRPIRADAVVLHGDRKRLAKVMEKRARSATVGWEDVRRTAESTYSNARVVDAVLRELGEESLGELLDVGTGSGSMLRVLGARARHAVGLDSSAQALRVARARVHGAGLNHCVFKRGDMYSLPFESGSFDAVAFDHVLSVAEKPAVALREAARVLRRGGRVIVVENDERFGASVQERLQVVLRRWLEHAGMECRKLKRVDVNRSRLLLALAQR